MGVGDGGAEEPPLPGSVGDGAPDRGDGGGIPFTPRGESCASRSRGDVVMPETPSRPAAAAVARPVIPGMPLPPAGDEPADAGDVKPTRASGGEVDMGRLPTPLPAPAAVAVDGDNRFIAMPAPWVTSGDWGEVDGGLPPAVAMETGKASVFAPADSAMPRGEKPETPPPPRGLRSGDDELVGKASSEPADDGPLPPPGTAHVVRGAQMGAAMGARRGDHRPMREWTHM